MLIPTFYVHNPLITEEMWFQFDSFLHAYLLVVLLPSKSGALACNIKAHVPFQCLFWSGFRYQLLASSKTKQTTAYSMTEMKAPPTGPHLAIRNPGGPACTLAGCARSAD